MRKRPRTNQMLFAKVTMSKTKPGFNGVGAIDLNDFKTLEPAKQLNGKFLHFDFLDLSAVDEDDEDYWNLAIRDEKTDERIEAQQTHFENHGFLTNFWPPIYGSDGRPRDGRGRIIAAKRNGERFIPISVYSYTDNTNRNYLTNGLKANNHAPSVSVKTGDVVRTGLRLISDGELKCDKSSVEDWLYNELEVTEMFSERGGVITKIIDEILAVGANGGDPLVYRQSREKWEEWCEKRNLKIDNKKRFLMSVDSDTYYYRAWCQHILPAISKCDDPIELVLYTNETVPEKARKKLKVFVTQLEYFYAASYTMVNNALSGIKLEVPDERPYIVLGAIPQIYGSHDLKSRKLIPIDKY